MAGPVLPHLFFTLASVSISFKLITFHNNTPPPGSCGRWTHPGTMQQQEESIRRNQKERLIQRVSVSCVLLRFVNMVWISALSVAPSHTRASILVTQHEGMDLSFEDVARFSIVFPG